MIVLDASVMIAVIDPRDVSRSRAVALLVDHVDETLALHVVTRAEVLVAPTRLGRLLDVERQLDELAVETIGLAADQAGALAEIRARTGLKLPDCCVLLAARERRSTIATFDDRMAREAEGLGLRVYR